MVRGFIQQEQVGFGQQDAGQFRPHAPAAGKRGKGFLHFGFKKPQPAEDRPRPGLQGEPAGVLEMMTGLSIFCHHVGQPVGIVVHVGGCHAGFQSTEPYLQRLHVRRAGEGVRKNVDICGPGRDLLQISHSRPPYPGHITPVGLVQSGQESQQRCLPAAVAADQRHFLLRLHAERDPAEHRLDAIALG